MFRHVSGQKIHLYSGNLERVFWWLALNYEVKSLKFLSCLFHLAITISQSVN